VTGVQTCALPILENGRLDQLAEELSTEEAVAAGSAAEQLFWEVFAGLSEADQRILLYHAQVNGEGHWAADLADEVGMTAGAIRVRRLRLMERLRAEMKRRGLAVRPEP